MRAQKYPIYWRRLLNKCVSQPRAVRWGCKRDRGQRPGPWAYIIGAHVNLGGPGLLPTLAFQYPQVQAALVQAKSRFKVLVAKNVPWTTDSLHVHLRIGIATANTPE